MKLPSGHATMPTTRRFAPGEYIFRLGDPGDCAYVINSGEVDIIVDSDGTSRLLAWLGEGKLFGEMAIIDRRARMASAVAASECVLTVVTIGQLNARLQLLDPVLRLCLDTITGRLRESMQTTSTLLSPEPFPVPKNRADLAVNRIRLENELRNAIENSQLRLYLQPILDLQTRHVVGFESLIRWDHPTDGLIGPDRFISIAESSGLIGGITDWVFAEACRARSEMLKNFGPLRSLLENAFISINLSAQDLTNRSLADRFMTHMDRYGVPPHCIKLEITESLLMSAPDVAALTLSRCREYGFQVAIDDFGTGFASFGYLQDFSVDGIKIDRRFISGLAMAVKDQAIVGSMIHLAGSLGIPVIAEGIEDANQADVLSKLGCGYVQGFLYAKPTPWQDLMGLDLFGQGRRDYDRQETMHDLSTTNARANLAFD